MEADQAQNVLAGYQKTSSPATSEIGQKFKTGWAAVKKRARALKLKHDVKNLHTAIDEKCETLGTLTLQHRPPEANIDTELAELAQVQEVLGQKQMTRDSLQNTPGSGSALKELKREITQYQARQRELMIEIGHKAEAARPEIPEAAAHYSGIDQLHASLTAKSDELATLEAEIGPILEGKMSRLDSFVKPLKLAVVAVAGILLVYLLWTLAAAFLIGGDVPRRYRYYVPDGVRGLSYIDFDRLRDTDLYANFEDMAPFKEHRLHGGLDLDDIEEVFIVTLGDFSSVGIVRTAEDLPLEDFLPKTRQEVKTSEYKGFEYANTRDQYSRFWAAKTDTRTYAVSDKEDALKNVLRCLDRREKPELDDELQTALQYVRKKDHYVAMRVPDIWDLYPGPPGPFKEVLDSLSGMEGFGIGASVGSSLDLNAAIVFRRERDAERFDGDFGDLIKSLEDALDEQRMPDEVRESWEDGLDMLKGLKTSCSGKVLRARGSWEVGDVEDLMERMSDK